MTDFIIYVLKSSLVLGLLYGLYFLLFRRETFYHYNRIYILGALVISLIFPVLNIQLSQTFAPVENNFDLVNHAFLDFSETVDYVKDINISFKSAVEILGRETAEEVRDLSLSIYEFGRKFAAEKGIIIADTKFEFGFDNDRLILIDEVLTPDSSRFWPMDTYNPGGPQHSFDKQYLRDYLNGLDWPKQPPPHRGARPPRPPP